MAAALSESCRPAFPPHPKPHISTGLPLPTSCAHPVASSFGASRVYIVVSRSISQTHAFTRLPEALGATVVGVRKGIEPHTPWDAVLDVVREVRAKGARRLTDGAKIVTLVRFSSGHFFSCWQVMVVGAGVLTRACCGR